MRLAGRDEETAELSNKESRNHMIAKIKKFVTEVTVELKKVSWSTRQEVVDATRLVIISSIFLGLFIAGTDFVLSKILGLIIR